MASGKNNGSTSENKPPVPTTGQLLARVYPIYSGRPTNAEPKATDLCRVHPRHWPKKNGNRAKSKPNGSEAK